MLEFYLTGTNPRGARKTLRIVAESSRDAMAECSANGYREITLHTDDVAAVAVSTMSKVNFNFFSPAESVQLGRLSDKRLFLLMVKKFYFGLWWVLLLEALTLLYITRSSTPPASPVAISILVLLPPVLFSASVAYLGPRRKFNATIEAACWGRWQEVLDRIPALRGVVPAFELNVRTACALAGLGRLNEALALYETLSDDEVVPASMYWSRLSGVYHVAHRYTDALECLRQAKEKSPSGSIEALDLAMGLLENEVDTDYATQLIDGMHESVISDLAALHLPFVNGLVALNTCRPEEAEALFYAAEQGFHPMAEGAPLYRLLVDVTIAYRAIALADQGRASEAQKLFDTARPRLEALSYQRLLARFSKAITQ
jgi:hypothetical protein